MDSSYITGVGLTIIVGYCIIQILKFYGIDVSEFGIYLSFYLFLFLSVFILPNSYPFI
jgi:hypothetical protein